FYEVPWNNSKAPAQGFAPRGLDVDSNNVVWTVLSSGQPASFDRRKCKGPLNGPTAAGQHCVEGWTLYTLPGPHYKGAVGSASAAPRRRPEGPHQHAGEVPGQTRFVVEVRDKN